MKITFLGTSAGIPDPDRHCSSTMIEVGERVYIVDAGAPMVDCLRTQGLLMERENAERIAAVFATHSHSDHFSRPDLLRFAECSTTGLRIWCNEKAIKALVSKPTPSSTTEMQ